MKRNYRLTFLSWLPLRIPAFYLKSSRSFYMKTSFPAKTEQIGQKLPYLDSALKIIADPGKSIAHGLNTKFPAVKKTGACFVSIVPRAYI